MSYSIKHSDTTKNDYLVNDSTVNTETSLTFPGRNFRGYAPVIAENFLHLLENFSSDTAPDNAIEGQLWYYSTQTVKELRVYDGTEWRPANSIKKGETIPSSGNAGDLFVHTVNQQIHLYTGSNWILVGPTFSAGTKTGPIADKILDSTNAEQTVLFNYVNDVIVSVISLGDSVNVGKENQPFVPKNKIPGFTRIYPGINIRENSTNDGIENNKFWGLAEKAESLWNGSEAVPAARFLRKDAANTVEADFIVKSDGGLTVGSDGQIKLNVNSNVGILYNSALNSSIEFRVNDGSSSPKTVIKIDSAKKTVGINKANPDRDLDVNGTGRFGSVLEVNDTTDSDLLTTITSVSTDIGALLVSGGATLKKNLRVAGDTALDKKLYFNSSSSGSVILPKANGISDIGSSDLKFRYVYSQNFVGTLRGDVLGSITGSSATANALKDTSYFNILGDVYTDQDVVFDGTGGSRTFNAYLSPTLIDRQDEIGSSKDSDFMLIYRPDDATQTQTGLYKIAKDNFAADFATVPIGTIMPFAGDTPPTDYLFCDGSEKPIGLFKKLYDVIGYKFGEEGQLLGYQTFKLPDMRGRFPLGRNNMDNTDIQTGGTDYVPSYVNPSNSISAGGGALKPNYVTRTGVVIDERLGRVNDSAAGTVGQSSGSENVKLNYSNLPLSENATGSTGSSVNRSTYDETKVLNSVSITNPYLAINYIIYAGRNAGRAST